MTDIFSKFKFFYTLNNILINTNIVMIVFKLTELSSYWYFLNLIHYIST